MFKLFLFLTLLFTLDSCHPNLEESTAPPTSIPYITAADISNFPEIAATNPIFYDLNGNQNDFLSILKNSGITTIRLRLWVHPITQHSGFNEVQVFSETLKQMGFKIWLSLHYSDSWADPGQQSPPALWQELDIETLKDSVYNHTAKVMQVIAPDFIQIGNEINSGFLHPTGEISANYEQFISLVQEGCAAVRAYSNSSKIIIHYAGIEGASWFFNKVDHIDYDIMGLSYYPIWHGKSLSTLKSTMQQLSTVHHKNIVIAETAYPFSLDWNDWTHNIVGDDTQLILPTYPATPTGQQHFIKAIKSLTKDLEHGIGFCYWGAELIAWKGNQSQNASPWENQALFDFDNHALPVLSEFKSD